MNEQERYLFDLQGFIVVPNALDSDQVSSINRILDEAIAEEVGPDMKTHRFGGLLGRGKPFRDLIDNPRVVPYLEEILGSHFRLDHDYADIIRTGLSPIGARLHGRNMSSNQYYRYQDGRMYNGLSVVAYNLNDVNPGDGGFACVPGSHKSNFPFPDEWRNLTEPHPCVKTVTGPAGTAIIFTEAQTHGPLPWHGQHERRTVFFKYCPHAVAWSDEYYNPDEFEDLSERQRSILRPPGQVVT